MKKPTHSRIPFLILAVLIVLTGIVVSRSQQKPVLTELNPPEAAPGETVAISGRNLGSAGRIALDGLGIPERYIRRWSPVLIVFTVPDNVSSGTIIVHTESGGSNPLFFSSPLDAPVVGPQPVATPWIDTVVPDADVPGGVMTISGGRFGPALGLSQVVFSRDGTRMALRVGDPYMVSWKDDEIRVLVPPGGAWTQISVEPYACLPVRAACSVTVPGQAFAFGEETRYALSQSVFLGAVEQPVTILFPRTPVGPQQPVVQTLRQSEHDWQDFSSRSRRVDLVPRPESPESVDQELIEYSEMVTRRSVRIVPGIVDLPVTGTMDTPDFRTGMAAYLERHGPVNPEHPMILALADSSGARDATSQTRRYQRVLDTVTEVLEPGPLGDDDIRGSLSSGLASSSGYAVVFVSLARSVGIPARRVSGLVIPDSGDPIGHQWAEVFVSGLGWVPVDVALEDGMYREQLRSLQEFYAPTDEILFRLDARRVAIDKDGPQAGGIYPGFPVIESNDVFTLGNRRVDVHGNAGLFVRWEEPQIIGRY